jgi:hypothetical protein
LARWSEQINTLPGQITQRSGGVRSADTAESHDRYQVQALGLPFVQVTRQDAYRHLAEHRCSATGTYTT